MDLNDTEIIRVTGTALMLGLLNWGLFGVLSVQVYLYSQAFPKDRPTFKAMVYGIYLLETTQTALLTESAWNTLVKGFGHTEALNKVGTMWLSIYLIGGTTAMVAQTFYVYRIWIISENNIIPIFIMLMSLTSFAAAVVMAAITKQAVFVNSVRAHAIRTSTFFGIWTATSSACDIVIAACICFYLSKRIRNGSFPKTEALISRVKLMTIETGALTATVSVITLALYYAPPSKYYGVPMSILAKLYSNAMLAVLNSRMKLSVISESTTWLHNELPIISLSIVPQESGGIEELQFGPVNPSPSGSERVGGPMQETSAVADS